MSVFQGITVLCLWIFPSLWIALSPPVELAEHIAPEATLQVKSQSDRAKLAKVRKEIRSFRNDYNVFPEDLTELKAYSYSGKFNENFFDSAGHQLRYVRLSEDHYVLQSFGTFEITEPFQKFAHAFVARLPELPPGSIKLRLANTVPQTYTPTLLQGADSYDNTLTARLFSDRLKRAQRLLVRNKSNATIVRLAKNESIEEFIWLPTNKHIIYTASSYENHETGIFLWDLSTGEELKLTTMVSSNPTAKVVGGKQSVDTKLALLPCFQECKEIYFLQFYEDYFHPDTMTLPIYKLSLNYDAFKSPENRTAIVPEDITTARATERTYTIRQYISSNHLIASSGEISKVQSMWLQAPLQHAVRGSDIEAWKNVSEHLIDTPMLPYALWNLSLLYARQFDTHKTKNVRLAQNFRAYALEVANLLFQYELTPVYLRSFALSLRHQLEQAPLPSVPTKPKAK